MTSYFKRKQEHIRPHHLYQSISITLSYERLGTITMSSNVNQAVGETTPFSVLATVPPSVTITTVRPRRYNDQDFKAAASTSRASRFVLSNSDANKSALNATLRSFFEATLADCFNHNAEAMAAAKAWLFINIAQSYQTHYWHRDPPPNNLGSPGQVLSRYSMTLVGPPTDVLRPGPGVDATSPVFTMIPRKSPVWLSTRPREAISPGQIYRFTIGQVNSPVHSTPVFNGNRIFVSVVYY